MNIPRKLCKNCFSPMNKHGDKCQVCGYTKEIDEPSLLPRGAKLAKRYIIGGNIGRGGFGVTYLAYDTKDKKTVAVKEYFPSMLSMRGRGAHVIPNSEKNAEKFNIGAEKFFDEAELVRQFNGNPNIVSIYECFYENNTAYYVMEYLAGITLENYVKKYGALTPSQTAYIADKLTMALVVLHSGKVLHRDISPDNVMLCKDGKVKLIDFGAARQFLSDGALGYTVIMKTGFSPMEQYSQDTNPDIRSDIYSAGTLLYYALTGIVPESPYKRIENDRAFHLNFSEADGGLGNVIEKAASIIPSERYQSAEEFRRALSELDISAAAVEVPNDCNSFKDERLSKSERPKTHVKARLFAVITAAVCVVTAIPFIVNSARVHLSTPKDKKIELTLDNEYAGHFNVGGKIPSSQLKKFEDGVEITLFIKPWEEMPSDDIHGVIPVNSEDKSVLEYLTSADELWADENGWINIEKGNTELSLVMSREGIESLGDGGLGFETYNLIITSAALKPSEKKRNIGINTYHKQRNAPYNVVDNENGKIITAELSEYPMTSWATYESQGIPKSAFYEFNGDVKVTVTIEEVDGGDDTWRVVYVRNSGYCFNVFDDDVLVPPITDNIGNPIISRDEAYGIHIDKSCTQLVFIIPQYVKEKMSGGVFLQCMNLRITRAQLEKYNGEYNAFI